MTFEGFTRSPFTCTRPPRTAPVAALRVLNMRAAQSHLSIRTLIHGAMIAVARERTCRIVEREVAPRLIPWFAYSSLLPPLELTMSCAWFERYREESSMISTSKPDKLLAKLDGLLDQAVSGRAPTARQLRSRDSGDE